MYAQKRTQWAHDGHSVSLQWPKKLPNSGWLKQGFLEPPLILWEKQNLLFSHAVKGQISELCKPSYLSQKDYKIDFIA